jgi:glycosyltransferase involved in cell wall biosynthesis
MEQEQPRLKAWEPDAAARPFSFLVSLDADERAAESASGEYLRVFQALEPVLSRLGSVVRLDRPESRLAYAAARARAEGFRPIHLVLKPPPLTYFTTEVPTVLLPLWPYPTLPNRPISGDPRQDWTRLCARADLILATCNASARAFRRAGLRNPVAVVPIPVGPEPRAPGPWTPGSVATISCCHETWGGSQTAFAPLADSPPTSPRGGGRAWRIARSAFRRVYPWLNPDTVDFIDRTRALARRLRRPRQLASPAGAPVASSMAARKEPSRLRLDSITYLGFFDPHDPACDIETAASAFVSAFRARPDTTLVIALECTDAAGQALDRLRTICQRLGPHECRIVLVTGIGRNPAREALIGASTYSVMLSRADASGLLVREALAAGRPVLAPRHSALADLVDDDVALVVRSHTEPTCWPNDPEQRLETTWERMDWGHLRERFLESARLVDHHPERYRRLSEACRARMLRDGSDETTLDALRDALARVPDEKPARFARAS